MKLLFCFCNCTDLAWEDGAFLNYNFNSTGADVPCSARSRF